MDHFRIWGCLAYAYIPAELRSKLDKRSVTCVFLGVSEHTKGYRLFNVENSKLLISRDVVFDEPGQWEWGQEYTRQMHEDLEWEDANRGEHVASNSDVDSTLCAASTAS